MAPTDTIDLDDPQLREALRDLRDAQVRLIDNHKALLADLNDLLDDDGPDADGLVGFEALQLNTLVKIGDEWCLVDHIDRQTRTLLVHEYQSGRPCFSYTADVGERFAAEEPF